MMEVLKNFKDLQKLGVRNIAQYSAANVLFPVFFSPLTSLLPYYPPCLQVCGLPEKLSLALVPRLYVLRMLVKLAYTGFAKSRTEGLERDLHSDYESFM